MFKDFILVLICFFILNQLGSVVNQNLENKEKNNNGSFNYNYTVNDYHYDYEGEVEDDYLFISIESFFKSLKNLTNEINIGFKKEVSYNSSLNEIQNHRNYWIGFGKIITRVTNGLIQYFLSDSLNVLLQLNLSTNCMTAGLKSLNAIKEEKLWIAQMIDASGRFFSTGFFTGTITDLGSFDQCLNIQAPDLVDNKHILGQYCIAKYNMPLPPRPNHLTLKTKIFDFSNTSLDGTYVEKIANRVNIAFEKVFRVAHCIPSSCTKNDLQKTLDFILRSSNFTAQVSHCQIREELKYNFFQKILIVLFGFIVVLSIVATLIDINSKQKLKLSKFKHVEFFNTLLAFSLYTNTKQLFDTTLKPGSLNAINGIRVLSMAWIIFTHTYLIPIKETFAFAENYSLAVPGLFFQFISNGWIIVDTFFVIGAILNSYNQLKAVESKGKINFLKIAINRFFRFLPSICFTILFTFVLSSISTGPLWNEYFDDPLKKCEKYWWSTILFINNWFSYPKLCMLHIWYLSADMQLFLLSFIFLIPLYKWGSKGLILPYIFCTLGMLTVFIVSYVREEPPTIIYNSPIEMITEKKSLSAYISTHVHLASYCVGIIFGFIIFQKNFYHINRYICILFWFISIVGSLLITASTYFWNNDSQLTQLSSSFYACFHRVLWALFVAWITFACVSGQGGFINNMLSLNFFKPLGKTSFMIYLCHYPLLWLRYGYLRKSLPFSHYTMFCEFIVNLVLSTIIGIIFYLLIEAPSSNLYRIHISKRIKWGSICLKNSKFEKELIVYKL